MYKKVRLMFLLHASISKRNAFMIKISLIKTIKDATLCMPQKRFDPGVSYFTMGVLYYKKKEAHAVMLNSSLI